MDGTASRGTDLEHTLMRMLFWVDLGLAYAYTGDNRYSVPFANQLGSWLSLIHI